MSAPADKVRPRLAGKARLKWDAVREKHLLLFPEGVLVLNPTAHAVLTLCDGQRTVAEIIQTLAAQYAHDALAGDVRELLQKLADKGLVNLEGAS
jgi:pyrroloquinoline quinone biosynthesis protein D